MGYKAKNSNPLHSFHFLKTVIICSPAWQKVGCIIFLSARLHSFCHIRRTASTKILLGFHFTARFCKPLRRLADGPSAPRRSYIMWCRAPNQLYDPSNHPPALKSDIWLLGTQDEMYSWGCKSFHSVHCCYYPSGPDKCKVEQLLQLAEWRSSEYPHAAIGMQLFSRAACIQLSILRYM